MLSADSFSGASGVPGGSAALILDAEDWALVPAAFVAVITKSNSVPGDVRSVLVNWVVPAVVVPISSYVVSPAVFMNTV